MKRLLFTLILCTCLTLLLVACNDQNQGAGSSKSSSGQEKQTNAITTPIPAPTFTKSAVSSIPTAINYYQALKDRDYAKAYTYLDDAATTTDGKKLTQESFTQMAQDAFSQSGAITNITMIPGNSDGTQIVTTIDRNASVHYHSHLTMKKEGSTWKILSFDRI